MSCCSLAVSSVVDCSRNTPKASFGDLDDMLRSRWEKLSDKEKVRYYQRAKSAVNDRDRTGALYGEGQYRERAKLLCIGLCRVLILSL